MEKWWEREKVIFGEEGVSRLRSSHVALFGLGGVGSYALEALVRAGVGTLTIVDYDVVEETNFNRQLMAIQKTLGMKKTDVYEERAKSIFPDVKIIKKDLFFSEETVSEFDFSEFDYMIDAIDSVASKILLIEKAKEFRIPILCSMGTANHKDAFSFRIADIEKTSMCPLAKVMRKELRNRGIRNVQVLYSVEEPIQAGNQKGTLSYVPGVAGLLIAGKVIEEFAKG